MQLLFKDLQETKVEQTETKAELRDTKSKLEPLEREAASLNRPRGRLRGLMRGLLRLLAATGASPALLTRPLGLETGGRELREDPRRTYEYCLPGLARGGADRLWLG